MTKRTKTESERAQGMEADMAALAATVVATKPQTIQVKQGIKSRGARQAWYELASAYDGKTVEEFMAAVIAHGAVSTYTARSKHAGSPHSARGYLRGLVRRGWVTLV